MMLGEYVRWMLSRRGIYITRHPGEFRLWPLKLKQLRQRGLKVSTAVDAGAASGEWTRQLLQVYPEAKVICVEPRTEAARALAALSIQYPQVTIEQVLLGEDTGPKAFNVHAEQSSVLGNSEGKPFGSKSTVQMVTLDGLLTSKGISAPDLVKLDLQGYELKCLAGARATLESCPAVLMEISFHEFQPGMPLFSNVISFMDAHGYALYDVIGLWNRPLDGAVAQGDFLFLKADHALRSDRRWGVSDPWA